MCESNFVCLNIMKLGLEGLIALGALLTAIFAIRSFFHSRKALEIQRESHRSWLIPPSVPGSLDKCIVDNITLNYLKITLENFGTNPADNCKGILYTYGLLNGKMHQNEMSIICNNPIAHKAVLSITNEIRGDFIPKYVVVVIDYIDVILNKKYSNNIFYWHIFSKDSDNKYMLIEVDPDIREDFNNTVKKHNSKLYDLIAK